MALILTKWRRGLDANLDSTAIEDGQILVTTDTARLLVNIDGSRIEITDFVKDTEANILATTNPISGKFYYATDTYKIYYYDSTDGWVTNSSELADKIKATLATTTKAYVLGVTASGTTPIYDSGVYLDTTAGKLTATTFNGYTLAAACAKALSDSSSASALSSSDTNVPTVRDIYYGLPTINGSHSYTSSTNIYAPTSAGTSGYLLTSAGSGAPTWTATSSISVSSASSATLASTVTTTLDTSDTLYAVGVTDLDTTGLKYNTGVSMTNGAVVASTYNGYTLAAACAKAVKDNSSATAFSSSGTSLITERTAYYGTPSINGSKSYTSSTTIYAPTSAGTSGYVLTSNGSGAPSWSAASGLSASTAASLATARTITLTGAADGSFSFDGSADVTTELKDNIIIGTQTASTSAWTGAITGVAELYDGLSIAYWLPYASTSTSVTLNLTLDDGTTTGAVNVYRSGTTRLTTYYTAGNVVRMTYRSGAVISGGSTTYTGWWTDGDYNADTTTKSASGDTSSLIYLIGATTQSTSGQTTYSHDTVYVGTDGHVYSNGIQVVNLSDTQALTNKTYNGYTLASACAKSYTDRSTATAISSSGTTLLTERAIYYGLPTINGSHSYTSSTSIYAPTSAGTSGYLLTSSGSGAPTWTATSSISVSSATSATSASTATLASTVTTTLDTTDALYAVGVVSTDTTSLMYNTGVTMTNGAVVATTYNGYTLASACAKSYTDSSSASAIGTGTSLVTERDVYYGLPKINNSHSYTSSSTYYAPTAGGTSGYVLIGAGTTSAPTWTAQSNIAAGSATYDSAGNTISTYYAPLASPALTGTPTATTATAGTSTTQIATTAFVTTAVNNAIAGTTSIAIEVVTSLPTTGTTGVIYLVADSHSDDNDSYDEYLWVEANSAFEKIGNTDVDLSNYVTLTGSQALTNKTYNGYTLAAACAKSVIDRSSATAFSSSGTSLITERTAYYGTPSINGSKSYTSSTTIYAPTSAGTSGYLLTSAGSGAPTWTATTSISVSSATSATSADTATLATTVSATVATTTKAYVLGVTATDTTPIYDTGVYLDTTAGRLTATSVNAALVMTTTNPTSATTYYSMWATGSGYKPFINNGYRYYTLEGTADALGYSIVFLGNSTASGTAANKYGGIRIYGTDAYYWLISGNKAASSNRTIYLPAGGGCLVVASNGSAVGSSTRPVYISSSGVATAMTGALSTTYGGTGTTTGHIAITLGTDTTSTATASHGGTFTAIDSVTRDDYGHVTAVNTKTVTLPTDNNTDTKVTQTVSTTSASYPLLLAPSGQTATTTTTAYFGTAFQANPSTGNLTATTFNSYTLASACAKSYTDSSSASAISTGTSLTTERDVYYGLPYINGSHSYNSSTNIYAPTSAGTSGYILTSSGSGAPTWTATTSISVSSATSATSADTATTATTATKVTATAATTTKAYVLGVTASGTTPIYDTGVYLDTTAGRITATTFNGGHVTTTTNPTSSTTYYPTWLTGSGTALRTNDGFRYITLQGVAEVTDSDGTVTTSAVAGYSYVVLGNSTANTSDGSKYGLLRLYGTDAYYWQISGGKAASANRTLYLPTSSGCIVIATNGSAVGAAAKPVYISSSGVATACSSTVGDAAKPVYMSSGTITACSSTVGSGTMPVYMSSGTITASSSTVGSGTIPVYMSSGTITASSSTVGSGTQPVYMSSGTVTASSSTVGAAAKPVYMSSGTITACSSTVGSTTQPVYMSSGTITAMSGALAVAYGGTGATTAVAGNAVHGFGYGTCSTAASTTAKTVSISSFALVTGGLVSVTFTYAVPASATLNVNSTGAKSIYHMGAAIKANMIQAGATALFVYTGSYFYLLATDTEAGSDYIES